MARMSDVADKTDCGAHARIQFPGEELANSLSHCIGLIATGIATPILLTASWHSGRKAFFIGTVVFALTMLGLYLASMLYHAWPQSRVKQILRVLDHCAIFFLIAGTYTPFSLGPLYGRLGSIVLATIWLLAIVGVLMKTIRGPAPRTGSGVILYLAMGWSALLIMRPLILALPANALTWLIAGGVAYTVGVLFYLNERMRYSHFVWHLFVVTGSSCHFLAILACTA
jgi:hemolysin III